VQVFVLPWNETQVALPLDSRNVQLHLSQLHQSNVHILRHPLAAPLKFSHHQKVVVIDQAVAFIGGIDLSFGRYDSTSRIQRAQLQLQHGVTHFLMAIFACVAPDHVLTDCNENERVWPGKDYYNPGICELTKVKESHVDLLDRSVDPRMPWHDISLVCNGAAAFDIARNFIQRWNHHKEDLDQPVPYLIPQPPYIRPSGTVNAKMIRSVGQWNCGTLQQQCQAIPLLQVESVADPSCHPSYRDDIQGAFDSLRVPSSDRERQALSLH